MLINNLFSVKNKNILISGATSGIGFEIAEALNANGANVLGIGRSPRLANANFNYLQCDINDHAGFDKLLKDYFDPNHNKLNVYFHIAGITLPSVTSQQSFDDFESTIRTNLLSAYNCASLSAELMKENSSGSIILVTSIGALLAFPNNPGYMASKGGLRQVGMSLANDYGQYGVRVNNLVPGYIKTNMTAKSYEDVTSHNARANKTMLNRWGDPSDLIGASIFLASNASNYITGHDLFVDGGWNSKGL